MLDEWMKTSAEYVDVVDVSSLSPLQQILKGEEDKIVKDLKDLKLSLLGNRAQVRLNTLQYELAKEDATFCVKQDPNNFKFLVRLAKAICQGGGSTVPEDYTQSIDYCNKALAVLGQSNPKESKLIQSLIAELKDQKSKMSNLIVLVNKQDQFIANHRTAMDDIGELELSGGRKVAGLIAAFDEHVQKHTCSCHDTQQSSSCSSCFFFSSVTSNGVAFPSSYLCGLKRVSKLTKIPLADYRASANDFAFNAVFSHSLSLPHLTPNNHSLCQRLPLFHPLFLYYFTACGFISDFERVSNHSNNSNNSNNNNVWRETSLTRSREGRKVMIFVAAAVRSLPSLASRIIQTIIQAGITNNDSGVFLSNAITVLNYAGVSLGP